MFGEKVSTLGSVISVPYDFINDEVIIFPEIIDL